MDRVRHRQNTSTGGDRHTIRSELARTRDSPTGWRPCSGHVLSMLRWRFCGDLRMLGLPLLVPIFPKGWRCVGSVADTSRIRCRAKIVTGVFGSQSREASAPPLPNACPLVDWRKRATRGWKHASGLEWLRSSHFAWRVTPQAFQSRPRYALASTMPGVACRAAVSFHDLMTCVSAAS